MEIVISVIVDSKVTNGHVEWAEYTSAHSLEGSHRSNDDEGQPSKISRLND